LRGYDYAQAGLYFVTLVTQERACLFGNVDGQEMRLNHAGAMLRQMWLELPDRFAGIALDEFIVMPNHIHGLIVINEPVGASLVGAQDAKPHCGNTGVFDQRATTRVAPTQTKDAAVTDLNPPVGAPLVGAQDAAQHCASTGIPSRRATTRVAPTGDRRYTLGEVVGAFKSLTTVQYVRGVKTQRWQRFSGKLWQRNYFEHVVRRDESLDKIRQYIRDNPARWEFDRENPEATPQAPEEL